MKHPMVAITEATPGRLDRSSCYR